MVWALVAAVWLAGAPGSLDGNHWAVGVEGNVAGRYNPAGAAIGARVTLRWLAFPPGHPVRGHPLGRVLFSPASVGVALVTDITPAAVRAGIGVEVMPAAVWRLRATYQAAQTFGTFTYLQPFDDPGASFGGFTRTLRSRANPAYNVPHLVQRLIVESLFQFKLSRVVFLDMASVELFHADDARWLYHGEYDLLVNGKQDVILRNHAVGAVSLIDRPGTPEVALGMFHAFGHSVRSRGQNQQVGAALILGPPLRAPRASPLTALILAGFHLQDRQRELTPYLVVLTTVAL